LVSPFDSNSLLNRGRIAAASWEKCRTASFPGLPPGIIHGNGI